MRDKGIVSDWEYIYKEIKEGEQHFKIKKSPDTSQRRDFITMHYTIIKRYFTLKNNSTFVCLLASIGTWSAMPPLLTLTMRSVGMPHFSNSVTI